MNFRPSQNSVRTYLTLQPEFYPKRGFFFRKSIDTYIKQGYNNPERVTFLPPAGKGAGNTACPHTPV